MSLSDGIYSPLNRETKSTRLLQFQHQQEDESLQCTLATHSLNDAPPFIALSYVWGAPEPTYDITINEVIFKVRENLWHALQRLAHIANNDENCISRQKKSGTVLPKYFWVDAVCINQDDNSERGHQVGLMKDIFSTAHFVISWIGQEEGEIAVMFEYLQGLKHTARRERNHYLRTQKRKFSFKDAKWFVSRPYWSRIWIVQEFTLARELWILCGPAAISWTSLQQFRPFGISDQTNLGFKHLSKSESHYSIESRVNSCRELSKLRRSWQTDPKRPSFTDKEPGFGARPRLTRLLAFSKDYQCTDPRDRVYGLLGLTEEDGVQDRLPADYNITPFQLYHRVIHHLKSQGQSFLPHLFRDRLAQGLQICDHESLPTSTFLYEIVASRCVKRLLTTGANMWREQFLKEVTEFLDIADEDDDSYQMFSRIIRGMEYFPSNEDPTTWAEFIEALKKALSIDYKKLLELPVVDSDSIK
ncbi:heterokaryon incompatibility protein-domain-containing protein [Colletotrichum godetiae]|uniref:Heterokaryon incompatibility protein-domain-containing protein n=1 Tax=Colletotrichum godetiae TaxID=1209918 RepID=A0AAJ0AS35_9PEZI|nr:heterokaryon incompatibility protein-domain-containing protein [Colletotrichum godetiae]KAK1689361.1 heterokaryon incompatibility protein-domain-containing protein [Colletotrichum godetiae]